MPWPKCERFSISVTRRSGLGDLSRCAASTTPLAPPPTMMMERVGLVRPVMRERAPCEVPISGLGLHRDRQAVPHHRQVVPRDLEVVGNVAHLGEAALV